MKKSRLRNKYLNTKNDIDMKAYNKKYNLFVSLIRQEKKNFFNNISTCDITDNKTFWKTEKLLFINKIKQKPKITLIEKKLFQKKGKSKQFLEK